ncbi:MAG: GDSL-type esterase/lipase family protein [Bacteroides sp.]|nr:GDSL-type esterase/lipase family protein [Bacteroides sp.]
MDKPFRYIPTCLLTFLLMTTACSGGGTVEIAPDNPDILYMGRILFTDSTAPTFTYPGTTAMLNFEGISIAMAASPGSGQFMVEIDSIAPFKINFTDSDSVITLADTLTAGAHTLRVTYAIEGYAKHPEFHGFRIGGPGAKLLPPPQRPDLRIEFIGNSITCGYGTEAENGDTRFSYDTENQTLSYAYLTARELNADFNIVARSGIGMYRSYGGPREGTPDERMPGEYDRTLIYNPSHYWNHRSFHPDIICINLGTNDTSLGNYDITLFEEAYKRFLAHLHLLQPQAKIVLLTGPMLHGKALEDVKTTLDHLAGTDDNFYRFDMSEQTGDLGYGADRHPSAAQAARNASELTAYLRTLIQDTK